MVIRTQEEILKRANEVNDLMGIQKQDLLCYLNFEYVKPFLNENAIIAHENGTELWEANTDPKKEILEYLDFAYEKAEGERSLSAMRSLLHFKTWIWLDDNDFYEEILPEIENYYDYGIPVLDKISKHYGFERQ